MVYDADAAPSSRWKYISFPLPRLFPTAVTTNNSIWVAGGYYWGGPGPMEQWERSEIDVYNPSAPSGQEWARRMLPTAKGQIGAATVGTKTLFAGGGISNPSFSSLFPKQADVDVFDSSDGLWTHAALSQARSGPAAASVGSVAIFAGGEAAQGASDVVDIYNDAAPPGQQWTTAHLSTPREYARATTANGRIYISGTGLHSNVLDVFDPAAPASRQWSTLTVPVTLSGDSDIYAPLMTPLGNCLLVYPLYQNSDWSPGNVFAYDTGTGQWSTVPADGICWGSAATSVGDTAIFLDSTAFDVYTVPEPATLSLLALGGLAVLRRSGARNR